MAKDKAEAIKVYCDFQRVAITETANALSKGITYYFLIMAVLTGILLTQEELSQELRSLVLILSITVTVFLAVAVSSISWTLYKGMQTLEQSLRALDEALFAKLEMDTFITRGIKHWMVVMGCSYLVLFTIIIGMCLIARQ